MTRTMMAHRTTARAAAALAVLGVIALGSTAACASGSATGAAPGTSAPAVPTAPGTPSGGPQTSIQPGGPIIPVPSGSAPGTAPGTVAPTPSGSPGGGRGAGSSVPALTYSTSGTTLTVSFFGGACEKYGLHADQSVAGEVRVTVVVTQGPEPGQMCPAVISRHEVSADLGAPLDGRKVLDTSTGKALPLAKPLPTGGTGGTMTHGPTKTG